MEDFYYGDGWLLKADINCLPAGCQKHSPPTTRRGEKKERKKKGDIIQGNFSQTPFFRCHNICIVNANKQALKDSPKNEYANNINMLTQY